MMIQIKVMMLAMLAGLIFLSVPAHATTIYDDAISYWKMDDNANNTTVADDKNAKTGTFIDPANPYTSAHSVSGKVGMAMSFDGLDDQVTFSPLTLGNTNWTVSAWVKTSSGGPILSNNSGGPVSNSIEINNGKIQYRNYDGNWQTHTGSITIDENWHFLTWVNFSNQTMNMYVDGVYDVGGFNSYTTNGGPVNAIGRNWYSTLNGSLDDVAIWNRALSPTEIESLYKTGYISDAVKNGGALGLNYTSDQINQLAEQYYQGKSGQNPTPITIGDSTWNYFTSDPSWIPSVLNMGNTYTDGFGHYYIKLGSGIGNWDGTVPEASSMTMLCAAIGLMGILKRMKGKK